MKLTSILGLKVSFKFNVYHPNMMGISHGEKKLIRRILSQGDKKWFADFHKRYPGWQIFRLEDNSLVFIKPVH